MQDTIDNNIVSCPACNANLYYYTAAKEEILSHSIIRARHFEPVTDLIPRPIEGFTIRCPFCKGGIMSSINKLYEKTLKESKIKEWDE